MLEVQAPLIGAIRMRRSTDHSVLEDLWVVPGANGQGSGRIGFERACDIGRGWGKGVMELEADPFAEPFYLHLGAVRVGMSPVTVVPGRAVPLMRYAL